jgi:hypothetical protein
MTKRLVLFILPLLFLSVFGSYHIHIHNPFHRNTQDGEKTKIKNEFPRQRKQIAPKHNELIQSRKRTKNLTN